MPSCRYSFEPLADHDRNAFYCGVAELDDYLRLRASQDARRKVAAPFVMVDEADRIAGYYTLSAYAIRIEELPVAVAKKLPRYPLIPATLLGRLALSVELRGQGLGGLLLMDALHRSLEISAEVASAGVIAEAMDEPAERFYLYHGFHRVGDRARKLFLPMKTIEGLFK